MASKKSDRFGLIGTITHDVITYASGRVFCGLGGILYQAAVLSGLGKPVSLYTNLGEDLWPEVDKATALWPDFRTNGVRVVPVPANSVFLHYPQEGERIEILESHVPPLQPRRAIEGLTELGMLIAVLNSGFDIGLQDWRKIVGQAGCPIWLDIHSLALSRVLHEPRRYRALPEWKSWSDGVSYLQANFKEVASMLGHPSWLAARPDFDRLGRSAMDLGVKAVFITLGREGVMVMTPKDARIIGSFDVGRIVDTTGCGDVFCAGTAAMLAAGFDPVEAAAFGAELASDAARVSGIVETYDLVRNRVYRA